LVRAQGISMAVTGGPPLSGCGASSSKGARSSDIWKRRLMATTERVVKSGDLAQAWSEAFSYVAGCRGLESSPLVVTISNANGISEDMAIRKVVDRYLAASSKNSVQSIASTIFPRSLWEPGSPASEFFARYD